jgi:hypothetical protein
MKIIILGPNSTGRGEISKLLAGKMGISWHSSEEADNQDEYSVLDVGEELLNFEAINIIKKQVSGDSIIVGLLADSGDEKLQELFKELCDFITYVQAKNPGDVASEILRDVKIVLNFKGD